jgi:hypothetical protein
MPERAALVTALIVERPMCEACILLKSGLSARDLAETLTVVRAALRVHEGTDRCRACGEAKRVLSLDRPSVGS